MSTPGFFDTLERQLGDGLEQTVARRRSRRRLAQRAAGLTLAIVAIAATVFVVTGEDTATADVSVETRDGLVYLRLIGSEFDADEIEQAARRAGLDVTVEAVPVGPSMVGRFVGEEQSGERAGALEELDVDGPAFSGFVVPAGFDGSIVLKVGRPASADEPYGAGTNAMSEGEPLACTGILGAEAADALDIVDERGLDAVWTATSATGRRPIDADDVASGANGQLVVLRALAISADRVLIELGEPGTELAPALLTAPAAC